MQPIGHRTRPKPWRGPCLCAVLAAAIAPAQDEPRTIIVQNLAPCPRAEWVHAVVPFEQGEVEDLPSLHAGGAPTVWQPFGARWPDGSVRQALCFFRSELGGLEEKTVELLAGPGPELEPLAFGLPPHRLRIVVEQGGERTVVEPRVTRLLEDNAARKVAVLRARIGHTGLVAEVTVESYAGQRHAYVGIGVFHSDPSRKALESHVQRVTVETDGMALLLHHRRRLAIATEMTDSGTRVELLRDVTIGDGQGIRRVGALVPPLSGDGDDTLQAAGLCPPSAATSWVGSGAFGPFGVVPEPPQWLRGGLLRAALARRHAQFIADSRRPGDPFMNGPFGLNRYPNQPGDQPDFGVVACEPVAYSGLPSFLFEVGLSVLQEACRPGHNFEADATPVKSRNHPDWVMWAGRTHWHCGVSKDRLGKPCPAPKYETHGWSGKDRQHWSVNYLCAYYLLTGCPQARLEIENEVQVFLASQTIRPDLTTSKSGVARGAGRSLLAGCWLWLCTGDGELFARMRDRIEKVHYPAWSTRELERDAARPFHLFAKDPRLLRGARSYWVPWEEALAAVGFEAFYRLSDHPLAKELAAGIATNVVRHGWRIRDDGRPECAIAVAWKGGPALTARERADPTYLEWPRSAFGVWCMGALEIARQAFEEQGEDELARLASESLARLRAGRRRPQRGFYDRQSMWDAVR